MLLVIFITSSCSVTSASIYAWCRIVERAENNKRIMNVDFIVNALSDIATRNRHAAIVSHCSSLAQRWPCYGESPAIGRDELHSGTENSCRVLSILDLVHCVFGNLNDTY
jgi:hypothetical protein